MNIQKNLLAELESSLSLSLQHATSLSEIYSIKSTFLGKDSQLHKMLGQIKGMEQNQKIELGKLLNNKKNEFAQLIKDYESKFNTSENKSDINRNIFLVNTQSKLGSIHPVTKIVQKIEKFLSHFNFANVKGIDVDNDWYNFGSLNFEDDHPARQMHDTFYMNYKNLILRTHTSNMQVRFMSENNPPFRFYSYGRTYRKDSDSTHTPMFHQMEIVVVDKRITIGNLKWFIKQLFAYLFDKEPVMRFRPNFFPFTESSLEVDMQFNGKWMEILGSGMIHENVLKNAKVDHLNYSGFAIGFGLDRLAMIKYGITDLRTMFEPDFNFLTQFNKQYLS